MTSGGSNFTDFPEINLPNWFMQFKEYWGKSVVWKYFFDTDVEKYSFYIRFRGSATPFHSPSLF